MLVLWVSMRVAYATGSDLNALTCIAARFINRTNRI